VNAYGEELDGKKSDQEKGQIVKFNGRENGQ
jgi:hypothetical protein